MGSDVGDIFLPSATDRYRDETELVPFFSYAFGYLSRLIDPSSIFLWPLPYVLEGRLSLVFLLTMIANLNARQVSTNSTLIVQKSIFYAGTLIKRHLRFRSTVRTRRENRSAPDRAS